MIYNINCLQTENSMIICITLKLTSVVIRQLYSSSETGLSLASGLQSRAHREKGLGLYSDKLKSNLNICINIHYFFQALN